VTAADSTFTDNTATSGDGGAIRGVGEVSATNSTFAGNTATAPASFGGAISATAAVRATNSTFTDNAAGGFGGAISGSGGGVSLVYATIVDNTAPTGANVHSSSTLSSFGSVLAGPMGGGANCEITGATSSTHSYSTDGSCAFIDATDTENGADPELGPLASNGGATQTRAPAATSPLVDAIPTAECDPTVTTDQRGVDRPQGPGCDIGAVELAPPAPPTTTPPSVCPATGAQAALLPVGATPDATGWLLLGGAGLLVAPVVWRSRAGRARARWHRPTSMRALPTWIRTQLLWLIAALAMIAVFVACQPVKKLPPC
jgi:predicted outer membrane repeat protein